MMILFDDRMAVLRMVGAKNQSRNRARGAKIKHAVSSTALKYVSQIVPVSDRRVETCVLVDLVCQSLVER